MQTSQSEGLFQAVDQIFAAASPEVRNILQECAEPHLPAVCDIKKLDEDKYFRINQEKVRKQKQDNTQPVEGRVLTSSRASDNLQYTKPVFYDYIHSQLQTWSVSIFRMQVNIMMLETSFSSSHSQGTN